MKKCIVILFVIVFLVSCKKNDLNDVELEKKTQYENVQIERVTENRYAYIVGVKKVSETIYLEVDYVDFFEGNEAMEAEKRDKKYFVDGNDTITNITNGYYISNNNPKIRVFECIKDVKLENVIDDSGVHKIKDSKIIDYEQWKKIRNDSVLLFLHVENGIIKSADKIFLP